MTIGLGSPDDAALISFPGAPPLLQTVDFFRAMVDDPYLFGRIAATHALGDIYAMGGLPETALAIATLPPARPAIVEHDLFHMLQGRHRRCSKPPAPCWSAATAPRAPNWRSALP